MLDLRHPCARFARTPGRSTLNFHLPFSLSGANALPIAATLGALSGLYLFFRGFSLLHRKPVTPAVSPTQKPAPITTATLTTTFSTQGRDSLTRDSSAEVIRLSTPVHEPSDATSMSQQGKIAAALLRAGIPNPASWSHTSERARVSIKVANTTTKGPASEPSAEAKVPPVRKGSSEPAALRVDSPTAAAKSPSRKLAWMLWGGAVLALASLYLLAAHFAWL
jgi:hypothetical protein